MAENWNDYGNYAEEEIYRNKSFWGKVFSFRTLKNVLKWFFYLLIIALFAIIAFRMSTSKPGKSLTSLICTPELKSAQENGGVTVFSQELDEYITRGGEFAVFDVKIIAETEELQFTIRYNNSTVKSLKEKISAREYESEEEKQSALDEISERPFVFVLRDEDGNIYSSYACLEYSKNVYQYVKVSFKIPELLEGEAVSPYLLYPTQSVDNPLYIYKGESAGKTSDSAIEQLSLEMYYENEALTESGQMGTSLTIYKASKKISPYNYKKELDGNVPDGIKYINVK